MQKNTPHRPEKKLEVFMSKKSIERRWKQGLIGLLWGILSNNSVFSVEKFFMSNPFAIVVPNYNGGNLENNLLHLSGEYTDDKSILNISYNKKCLGSFWDSFPSGEVV